MSESSEGPRLGRLGLGQDAQAGLTLVELLVVLLVVGILLAIAIPPRLSPAKTAHKAAQANLLYTNGPQSRLGACSGRTVPTLTAIDEGLVLLRSASSTRVRTRSTTAGDDGDRPVRTECGMSVGQESTQPTGPDVAGNTKLPVAACRQIPGHPNVRPCTAESTLAGTGYSSAQST